MKKWTVVTLMAIVVGLFWSCSDDSSTEPENQYIEVNIISPINNSEFNDGDSVTIEVEATTNVGSINEVVLVIDRFTQCEKFIDNNNNDCFDREEFTDNNANSNWDEGEPYIDANFNNQYDGDFLYDSNANNLWDFWDIDQGFTGFNNDICLDTYITDFDNNNIVGDNELFLNDSISPYSFNIQAKLRYIDGDILYDTGEPYIDQKRMYIIDRSLVKMANNYWDEGEVVELDVVDITDTLAFEDAYPGFWTEMDLIQSNEHYMATVAPNGDSTTVTITYSHESFADLRSSLGSTTQTTPRFNAVYDSVGNGIQDEFEAYCSRRFYGSYDVSDNILGWSEGHSPVDNPSDYVEFIGSYTIFKCPVEFYQNMPNISDLTFDSYSTWIDINSNGLFDTPNSLFDFDASSISSIEAIAIDNNGNSVIDQISIKITKDSTWTYPKENGFYEAPNSTYGLEVSDNK